MVKLKPSETLDTAGETCFPMSASISDGQGVSDRMGVTVTVIADDLLLLCACFGSLACGGMLTTVGLADSETTRSVSISTTAGFNGRDGFGAAGRMGLEAMEGGKRAGIAGCGSLGREVYNIMAQFLEWTGIETAHDTVETCQCGSGVGVGLRGPTALCCPKDEAFWKYGRLWREYPVLGAAYCEVAGAVARVLGGAGYAIRMDGRPQGYLLLDAQYSAVLRQTLPRRYRNPSGRLEKKVGLKWKGQNKQRANERRAIRANGWGGVRERPNCQAHLRLAPLVSQWCLAESIVHVRCVSDSSGAR